MSKELTAAEKLVALAKAYPDAAAIRAWQIQRSCLHDFGAGLNCDLCRTGTLLTLAADLHAKLDAYDALVEALKVCREYSDLTEATNLSRGVANRFDVICETARAALDKAGVSK